MAVRALTVSCSLASMAADPMSDHIGVGAPRKRKEDPRFLTGASCFTADIALAGQLHGVLVRSPHAHARIRAIDLAAVRAAPGVRLVVTAAVPAAPAGGGAACGASVGV